MPNPAVLEKRGPPYDARRYELNNIWVCTHNDAMPTIATLEHNIVIRMFGRDHLPHHIHVEWRGEEAIVLIADSTIYAGGLTGHVHAAVAVYVDANRAALTERFFAINPNLPRPKV